MGTVSTMGPWKLLCTPSTGGAVGLCFAAVKPFKMYDVIMPRQVLGDVSFFTCFKK